MSTISAINDTFIAIAGHLKTWLRIKNNRVRLTATSTGATASTNDHDWLTLVLPANQLKVGDRIDFEFYGFINKGLGAVNLNFFTKRLNTKLSALTVAVSDLFALNNHPFRLTGQFIVRSIGQTGILQYCYQAQVDGFTQVTLLSSNISIDTTNNISITVGCNFGPAVSGTVSTTTQGYIDLA